LPARGSQMAGIRRSGKRRADYRSVIVGPCYCRCMTRLIDLILGLIAAVATALLLGLNDVLDLLMSLDTPRVFWPIWNAPRTVDLKNGCNAEPICGKYRGTHMAATPRTKPGKSAASKTAAPIPTTATVATVGSKSPGSSLLVCTDSVGTTSSCFAKLSRLG
jgi:hypothetical protein